MSARCLIIQKYHPEVDREPYVQRFPIELADAASLLEALQWVHASSPAGLAFRWACRMGMCGGCGITVEGAPKLACQTFLREYSDDISVGPLAHFPIERDLVVDMSLFLRSLSKWKVYPLIKTPQIAGISNQMPHEVSRYAELLECIACGLCYAACPQFGLNPAFAGPAAIAMAQRYNRDSRDSGQAERLERLNAKEGVWGCTLVGTCSAACPKRVFPASAIQQTKLAIVRKGLADTVLPALTARQEAVPEVVTRKLLSEPIQGFRPYIKRLSRLWWKDSPQFRGYILREMSAFSMLWLSGLLLWGVLCLSQGSESWQWFLAQLSHPVLRAGSLMAFLGSYQHALTWYQILLYIQWKFRKNRVLDGVCHGVALAPCLLLVLFCRQFRE